MRSCGAMSGVDVSLGDAHIEILLTIHNIY